MSWLVFIGLVAFAIALFWLPGLILVSACGIRKDTAFITAPAVTVILVTVAGVLAPKLSLSWSLVPVLGLTLLAFLVILIVRRQYIFAPVAWDRIPSTSLRPSGRFDKGLLAIIAGVFVLMSLRFVLAIQVPDAVSQTWDNAFHINAIQAIVETGNASTLNMDVYDVDAAQYYPAAFHDLVSLLVVTLGVPVSIAINALTCVIAFGYWPLAIAGLARVASGRRAVVYVSVPLSLAFPQFPMGFIWYGTLYPNLLAMVFLPLAVMATVVGLRLWSRLTWRYVALTIIALVAIGLSQPNVTFLYAIAFFVIAGACAISRIVARDTSLLYRVVSIPLVVIGTVGALGVFNMVLDQIPFVAAMRSGYEYWKPQGNLVHGVLNLVTLAGGNPTGELGIYKLKEMLPWGFLVGVGLLIACWYRRYWWIVSAYLMWGVMFVVCYWIPSGPDRVYWVGIWYCDLPRLTAPLMVITPILAAIALVWVFDRAKRWIANEKLQRVGAVLVAILTVISTWGLSYASTMGRIEQHFRYGDPRGMVDDDERELFAWMKDNLPQDAVVVGNPWEGATFSWGLGERKAAFPKVVSLLEGGDYTLIAHHLQDPSRRDEVCAALDRLDITYVLDLEDIYLWEGSGWNMEYQYRGFDNVSDSDVGQLVSKYGEAELYKITMCH